LINVIIGLTAIAIARRQQTLPAAQDRVPTSEAARESGSALVFQQT